MSIPDHITQVWTQILDFIDQIVSPDWGSVINLLPILVVIGVVGPLLSLLAAIWFYYFVSKPRAHVSYEPEMRQAPLDDAGSPVFPPGEPYCPRDGLIFPSGTVRCDQDQTPLSVICPMCGIGRSASITTCGNCGLVLKVETRNRVMKPAGPPPGGAAAA